MKELLLLVDNLKHLHDTSDNEVIIENKCYYKNCLYRDELSVLMRLISKFPSLFNQEVFDYILSSNFNKDSARIFVSFVDNDSIPFSFPMTKKSIDLYIALVIKYSDSFFGFDKTLLLYPLKKDVLKI